MTAATVREFEIEVARFNSAVFIGERLGSAPAGVQSALATVLRYLYDDGGPVNLPRDRLRIAFDSLEPAEKIVVRWLYTRTNGKLRKTYGQDALKAARAARYRCQLCGYADVRALHIDHIEGRVANATFACLCANCHMIKSREQDWMKPELRLADAAEG